MSTEPPRRTMLTDRLVGVAGGAAGIFLFALMMVTVVDVVGRYFFGSPLRGAFEITQVLMAAIVFSGLPQVSRRDGHITIDLLDSVTPARLVPVRQVMVHFAATACFAVFSWRLVILANDAAAYGDVTEYLRFPRAPIIYFGAVFCAIAAIIHLSKIFHAGRVLSGSGARGPGL